MSKDRVLRPRPFGRRLGALLVAASAFLAVSTSAADGTRVGVVDLQGALLQTQDGMSAAATLKNYTVKRQNDLDRRQKALQKEQDDLQKQSALLSRSSLMRRTEHWQRRMEKVCDAVKRVASSKGFDVVVDRAAAPYARADLDITGLVVQRYNSGGGGGKDAPKDDDKQ